MSDFDYQTHPQLSVVSTSAHPLQLAKIRAGAGCGSDYELLIAIFRLKLKESRGTRPFRYDLHQIPYDYTLEMMNRFKGLDMVDRGPEELWTEVHNVVQEVVTKMILKKKKCKKAKWLSEDVLQIPEKRKEAKGERERYTQLNAEFQRTERRNKKAFLSD